MGEDILFSFSHFHLLRNNQTFICTFGFDIPASYLWLKRMKLAVLYSMRFIHLSELTFNRLLIAFCLLIWNILFISQQKNRIWTHFVYHPSITKRTKLETWVSHAKHMGQSIQDWSNWNLWKTAFKKFEVILPVKQTISLQFLKKLSPINFTRSILEYFVPYVINIHPTTLTAECKWAKLK